MLMSAENGSRRQPLWFTNFENVGRAYDFARRSVTEASAGEQRDRAKERQKLILESLADATVVAMLAQRGVATIVFRAGLLYAYADGKGGSIGKVEEDFCKKLAVAVKRRAQLFPDPSEVEMRKKAKNEKLRQSRARTRARKIRL